MLWQSEEGYQFHYLWTNRFRPVVKRNSQVESCCGPKVGKHLRRYNERSRRVAEISETETESGNYLFIQQPWNVFRLETLMRIGGRSSFNKQRGTRLGGRFTATHSDTEVRWSLPKHGYMWVPDCLGSVFVTSQLEVKGWVSNFKRTVHINSVSFLLVPPIEHTSNLNK